MSGFQLTSYDLKYKKQGINYRVRRLAAMLGRYEKQFNRMKNFTRDQWKTYIRDVRRCVQLNSVVQRHTRQVKLERTRLTQLVTRVTTATPDTAAMPGPSDPSAPGPSSSSNSALPPPSNQSANNPSSHGTTSTSNNNGSNPNTSTQTAANTQTLNIHNQTTTSLSSSTLPTEVSGMNYTQQITSESMRLSGIFHTNNVSGSHQNIASRTVISSTTSQQIGPSRIATSSSQSIGPAGILRTDSSGSMQNTSSTGILHTGPSGSYQNIGPAGISRTGPSSSQSIGSVGILRTGPSGSQSIGPAGISRTGPSSSQRIGSVGILRTGPSVAMQINVPTGIVPTVPSGSSQNIQRGIINSPNIQNIKQSQNIGPRATAITPNVTSTITRPPSGHSQLPTSSSSAFVPYSILPQTHGFSFARYPIRNTNMTPSSLFVDLTMLSDDSD